MIKVLIADDHPLMAEGIKNTFANDDDIQVVGVVHNGKEVLSFISDTLIDLVLLDIDMPVMNGLECAKELLLKHSHIKVVMLSMHQEKSLIKSLIEQGIKGYMLKTIPKNELIQSVKTIYNGGSYFNADIAKALLQEEKPLATNPNGEALKQFSTREKEIIIHLANGLTNMQIGKELHISHRTVDTHRTNIMKKLDVHNVAGIIRFAFQNSLIS